MKNRSNRDLEPEPPSLNLDDEMKEEELFRRATAEVKPLSRKEDSRYRRLVAGGLPKLRKPSGPGINYRNW